MNATELQPIASEPSDWHLSRVTLEVGNYTLSQKLAGEARESLTQAVRKAHEAGHSYRTIAPLLGVTRQAVAKMLSDGAVVPRKTRRA